MTTPVQRACFLLVSTAALAFSSLAQAQYVGPSTVTVPQSVAEILKNPVDDQAVVLRGVLLRKVSKEKYIFSDGKSEIRVEIEDEDFPAQRIDDKTRIEIRGEVEKEFMDTPEIDVKRVTILK